MKETTRQVLQLLRDRHPGQTKFYRKDINAIAAELKLEGPDYPHELCTAEYKLHKGYYDFARLLGVESPAAPVAPSQTTLNMSSSAIGDIDTDVMVPAVDEYYVRWGHYADILSILRKRFFYPTFIMGLSGNGKSVMIEQACAQLSREYIRVQISPETDEDDLIGGFRLVNGQTVFSYGPVIKAMKAGAILNLDEIDRGTNKIMCLQGILEGKPVLIKKTGEIVRPSPGFNVFATANTKGKGSEDGRFTAATIIDEAFLERFACTLEQPYPDLSVERKIVEKHMEKYGKTEEEFAQKLCIWSETIRKTFESGGIQELISTRRLCHIVQTWAIFEDRLKSIKMCISRFDDETRKAFEDIYTKIDGSILKSRAGSSGTPIAPNSGKPASNKIPF